MISQQTPHSLSPARRIRSTVASVCPLRTRTPPALAINGNTCPGFLKSSGRVASSTHFIMVYERSAAEIPVVVSLWSMDTVNAVPWLSVFSDTMGGRPSRDAASALMGVQISPFAWVAMKLMFSWVANCAPQIMSPSFSRSGSSVTRIIFPARKSSTASSIVLYWYCCPILSLLILYSVLSQEIHGNPARTFLFLLFSKTQ